jgi:hypothetical protein
MRLNEAVDYSRLPTNNIDKLTHNDQHFDRYSPLIGIEVEVENINQLGQINHSWRVERDGSLRNNGQEFISKPLKPEQVETAIEHLFDALDKNAHFSPRTSVHVHMNCRELTFMQVYNIVLLYQCFEDLLYGFAGRERKKSIFCVPIGNTNYYNGFRRACSSDQLVAWSKYTGLNIAPLREYGTVEFRHLRGTNDKQVIYKWLHFLYKLWSYAVSQSTDKLEAMIVHYSNNRNFNDFGEIVFGSDFADLVGTTNYNKTMVEDLAISKLFMSKLKLQGIF